MAIILHRRLAVRFKGFHAIIERLCAADVDIEGAKCRFICVYMPHGKYDDVFVEAVYKQMEALCEGKSTMLRNLFIGGDCNAVVGGRQLGDDPKVIGRYGIGLRNQRGQWLIDWATSHKMAIANTLFCKRWERQWTHDNGINMRQIDYWMYRLSRDFTVENTEACEDITIGTDHRAVRLEFSIKRQGRRKRQSDRTRTTTRQSLWGWETADQTEYEKQINEAMSEKHNEWQLQQVPVQLEQKCLAIERILTDIGKKCQRMDFSDKGEASEDRARLHELINDQRKARTAGRKSTARDASKLIQKEVRAVARARKRAKIGKILEEFRGLRDITNIRNNMNKLKISSMKCKDGSIKTDRQDIVDVFAKFYGDLFKRRDTNARFYMTAGAVQAVRAVTIEEVAEELKRMQKRKACDANGVVAELLKVSGEAL